MKMLDNLWFNPFFWIFIYLAGYIITILSLGLFGMEKVKEKIPRYLLRVFIFLVFVLPPVVLPFTEGPSITVSSIATLFIGIFSIGVGFIIRVIAQRQVGVSPALKSEAKLITTGIYSFSRHPLYISNGLFAIGMAILFNSLYAFIFSIIYSFLYLPIIYFEEKNLLKKYGEEYKKYKEKVGLLFPKREK